MTKIYSGGCACGQIRYKTNSQPVFENHMHVAFKWIHLNDNVHASFQSVTATFAHPIGCAAL